MVIKCLECRQIWASLGLGEEYVSKGEAVCLQMHSSLAHLFKCMCWGDECMCILAYLCFQGKFLDEKPQFLHPQLQGSPRGTGVWIWEARL